MNNEEKIVKLKKDNKTITEDLAIALNALRFYGNGCNWTVTKRKNELDSTTFFSSDIAEDNGQRARITVDSILKVRTHRKHVEESRHSYNDMQLAVMGYQVMPMGLGFIVAKQPEIVNGMFTFTGIGLEFTIDIANINPFETNRLARVAISNYINKKALIIKSKG